ncbi:DUF4007 family protein [Allocoleopsis sp.]|uniref:DUF4007 family protein n=1 Tax=Allocoleopsis sp. TaxID=3088169 RepID=UPI002FD14926
MAKTIGFYQNFNLDLKRLSTALLCVQANPELGHDALAQCMGVNRPVAEGFSAWLRHTGLATLHHGEQRQRVLTYELTPFGQLASQYDPTLTDLGTQWVLHYYLSTEHTDRSDAWRILINEFLSPGLTITSDKFGSYFASVMGSEVKNRSALSKDPQTALSTYVRPQALGRLGILTKQKTTYIVGHPTLPHIYVVGYLLFDWWQRRYNQTNTLRFAQLCKEEGSLGRLCQADDRQVRQFVVELAGLGYLSFSETQHEPVNRLDLESPHVLLERYYRQQ